MVYFRKRKSDGRVFPVGNRAYTDSRVSIHDFFKLTQQDAARRKILENEARAQLLRRQRDLNSNQSLSERVKKVLAKLTPTEIKVTLSADMTFLHMESEVKWDLIRRNLVRDLTPEQKMKLLKATK